ncbi:CHASE domain-containing protein [Janthinobacterium sp.]|uniref:CHASE domain-containing protein n=1 Tax=Janthinobacterium sp. TaxID=1871054 RepID=UPI00258E0D30|nr:CHASE domain-containing protein [Janthinobacterium sp.]MCX7292598.1 CHASE domain-containing protein [Janthinobacterium sp.]
MSVMVALLFYVAASLSIENDASDLFNNLARNTQKNIESRVKSYANLLRGTASLFHANEHVNREQFHRYVANIALQQNYPGVMNLNYSQELDGTQRTAFETAMQRDYPPGQDGYPPFAIDPPAPRSRYSVLMYIEPIASAPEKLGYDIASRPLIAEALAQSRDSGQISNSGVPVPMEGRPQLTGMAMRLPVYRYGMPTGTVEQRRAAYQGSVGIGYDLVTMMRSALADMPVRNVRLTLFDIGPQARAPPWTCRTTCAPSSTARRRACMRHGGCPATQGAT